jgi:hypothetical protein
MLNSENSFYYLVEDFFSILTVLHNYNYYKDLKSNLKKCETGIINITF